MTLEKQILYEMNRNPFKPTPEQKKRIIEEICRKPWTFGDVMEVLTGVGGSIVLGWLICLACRFF